MMNKYLFLIPILCCLNVFSQTEAEILLNSYKDSVTTYSISVLVNNKGKIDTASIGQVFDGKKINASYNFGIGSCTKMYTAALVLSMVQENQISLDDKIEKFNFYKKFKNLPGSISIKNLLNHSSGINDYITPQLLNSSFQDPYGSDYSGNEVLKLMDSVIFPANTKHEYSNSNYYLLRLILEEIKDKDYEIILEEEILEKYNLTNTYAYYSKNSNHLAPPMFGKMALDEIQKRPYNELTNGVGNIVSNVVDLNKFFQLLMKDKKIVNPELLTQMLTFDTIENKYGLGIMQYFNDGERVIGHSGRGLSYTAFIYYSPENDVSVIVLANDVNDLFGIKIYKELFKLYK